MLEEFGFPKEAATLACSLTNNDLESAAELLAECDSNLLLL